MTVEMQIKTTKHLPKCLKLRMNQKKTKNRTWNNWNYIILLVEGSEQTQQYALYSKRKGGREEGRKE